MFMRWFTTGSQGVQPVAKATEVLVLRASAVRVIFCIGYNLVGAAKHVVYNNAAVLNSIHFQFSCSCFLFFLSCL